MSHISLFNSPFLVGFDDIERVFERVAKSAGEGYPPYNIEKRLDADNSEHLVITLAVAGFLKEELDVRIEDNQLIVSGAQNETETTDYLHRGIAARQFTRAFILADGVEVTQAELKNGLLSIELVRPQPQKTVKKIAIISKD